MKKLLVLALAVALSPMAAAKVWVTVYRHDGKTPLTAVDSNHPGVYRDIMVGTRLTLLVSSDRGEYFLGHLRLSWEDAGYGRLAGRGYLATLPGSTAKYPNYKGSCLDPAGTKARARDIIGPEGIGLEFSSDYTALPGDWFVFDYHAEQIGSCNVRLYERTASGAVPIQTLSFNHIPSRDFNGDGIVNLRDFALFASRWHSAPDPSSNDRAELDLSADGRVDFSDLAGFSAYWLEQADDQAASAEPNDISKP